MNSKYLDSRATEVGPASGSRRGSVCLHMQGAYADRPWAFAEIKALVVGGSEKSGGVADLCGLINMP